MADKRSVNIADGKVAHCAYLEDGNMPRSAFGRARSALTVENMALARKSPISSAPQSTITLPNDPSTKSGNGQTQRWRDMNTQERLGFDPKILRGLRLEHAGVSATSCVIDIGDGEQHGVVSVQDDELVVLQPEQIPTAPVLSRRVNAVVADRFVPRVLASGTLFSLFACIATAVLATFHLDDTRPGILPPTEPGIVLLKAIGGLLDGEDRATSGEVADISEPVTATPASVAPAPVEPVLPLPSTTAPSTLEKDIQPENSPTPVPQPVTTPDTAPAASLVPPEPEAGAGDQPDTSPDLPPVVTTPVAPDTTTPTVTQPTFPPATSTPSKEFGPAPQP
jgi:hypothetical protein